MKLQIFSDIHTDWKALERLLAVEADYYISAGDQATWGRGLDRCGEILRQRADKVHVLPGNHESAAKIEDLCRRYGLHNFHEQYFQAGKWQVAGLGYSSPTPFHTPGEYSEAELERRLEKFADLRPLVLICHAPPYGTELDRIRNGLHGGSTAVREFIERHHPEHFFCGHIHEAEGAETRMGATIGRNAGKTGYLLELEDTP